MAVNEKPTIETVLKYATPQVRMFIGQMAADLPAEQKQEIEQDCYFRLIHAYEHLDPDMGWKSFVYNHCRGSVLDYIDLGRGFQETRKTIKKDEKIGSRNESKMKHRVSLVSEQGDDLNVDDVLAMSGKFSEMDLDLDSIKIKWALVSCMAAQDIVIHVFAKHLRGIGIEDMVPVFGLSRARVGQLIQAFIERFDDPEYADCPWFKQTCYAFGISRQMGFEDIDMSEVLGFKVGWGDTKVDLDSLEPCLAIIEEQAQLNFFGEEDLNG